MFAGVPANANGRQSLPPGNDRRLTMQVSSLSGLYQANFLENTDWAERRDKTRSADRSKSDTVSLSEESLSLAAAMASRKARTEEGGTDSESSAGNGAGDKKDVSGRSGAAVCVNGKLSTEEELHAEIHRVEKEVKELGEQMADIMDGPFSEEEKARLSKPVYKRLQERVMDLQNLKAQAKAMQETKAAESQSRGLSA